MTAALLALLLFQNGLLTVQPNRPNSAPLKIQSQPRPQTAQTSAAPPDVIWPPERLALAVPKPHAEDVASPEAIIRACYSVISGPPGPRDWDRFRSLFLPDAHLQAAYARDAKSFLIILSVEDYVHRESDYFSKNGFFEKPMQTNYQRYGRLVQAWSSYASRSAADGTPFARGINSFTLLNDGSRWWIADISWAQETPQNPIPAEMQDK